jgi:hypothetical protein
LQAAVAVQAQRLAEAVLLEKIRAAFNAKHVIQVCSSQNKEEVLAGARCIAGQRARMA